MRLQLGNWTRPTLGDAATGGLVLFALASAAILNAALPRAPFHFALAMCALSIIIGLWQPQRVLTLAAVVVLGLLTAAIIYLGQKGVKPVGLAASVVLVAGLGVAALAVSQIVRSVYRRVAEYRRISEALTPLDASSGALKPAFGREKLRAEVARAFRYQRSFSLLIGRPADWRGELDRRGTEGATEAFNEAIRLVASRLRNTDIVALEPDHAFSILLTETTAEGGEYAAQHLQSALRSEGQMDMRFGLVQFPDDGVTEDKLISEAYDALTFAEMANMPMASRRELLTGAGSL